MCHLSGAIILKCINTVLSMGHRLIVRMLERGKKSL